MANLIDSLGLAIKISRIYIYGMILTYLFNHNSYVCNTQIF